MPFTHNFRYTGKENTANLTLVHLPAWDGPIIDLIKKSGSVQWLSPHDENSDKLNEMLASEDSATRLFAYDIIKNKYNNE